MTLKSAALLAAITMYCFACDNKATLSSVSADQITVETADRSADSLYSEVTDSAAPRQIPNSNASQVAVSQRQVDWDKKIIKTASLNAEVKDYKAFSRQLSEKVKKSGGYISQEEQSQTDYQIQNSLVIKVPVDQFETAISELTKDVSKLSEKRISSEDVTAQLVDGKSRLEARKQVRLRYLELLKQARNMEEVLSVQKEIDADWWLRTLMRPFTQ